MKIFIMQRFNPPPQLQEMSYFIRRPMIVRYV